MSFFNCLRWPWSFAKRPRIKALIVGLDAAGKTTILYKLKLGKVETTIPTIGFNVETVAFKNSTITAFDVGGRNPLRPLYRHYMEGSASIVFVVDSNDVDRISDAKDELHRFVSMMLTESGGLASKPQGPEPPRLLIVANKQDLPNAMSSQEIAEKLDLRSLKNISWFVQAASATTGEGLFEGFDWLTSPTQQLNEPMLKQESGAHEMAAHSDPAVAHIRSTKSATSTKFKRDVTPFITSNAPSTASILETIF